MLADTTMGSNVSLVAGQGDCYVYKVQEGEGEGTITMYHVLPGLYILYNDFHMGQCFSQFQTGVDMVCIDHCREGRIEWEVKNNSYVYLEAGDMQISTRSRHMRNFGFPLKHYHGITVGICIEEGRESLNTMMDGFSVDLESLLGKVAASDRPFIMRAGRRIEHIFSEMYDVAEEIRNTYFKIKIIELLLFLEHTDIPANRDERPYLSKSQVEKTRQVMQVMTENLEHHYTLQELSAMFAFPLTTMKCCFKGVYGMSIYAYARTYRMNAAAVMLKQTQDSVLTIANKVGYENASKFAAAFKSVLHSTPAKYREMTAEAACEIHRPGGAEAIMRSRQT